MIFKSSFKRFVRVLLCVLFMLVVASAVAWWKREELQNSLLYHKPIRLNADFQKAIAGADRIVIREGGFDCCTSSDRHRVITTIMDVKEVRDIALHIKFAFEEVANVQDLPSCMCCGYPGIDWYQGNKRVALTSMHHGESLRWKGFSTARILGVTVGYGDAPLASDSKIWFKSWLEKHGGSEEQLERRIGR